MALRRAACVLLVVLHVVPTFLAQQTECSVETQSIPVSGAAGDQSMFSESVLERHCSHRRLLAPPWSRGTPPHLVRTSAGMTRHAVKGLPTYQFLNPLSVRTPLRFTMAQCFVAAADIAGVCPTSEVGTCSSAGNSGLACFSNDVSSDSPVSYSRGNRGGVPCIGLIWLRGLKITRAIFFAFWYFCFRCCRSLHCCMDYHMPRHDIDFSL